MLDHADTRTGRADNRIAAFPKGVQKIPGNIPRLGFEPVIEVRLSTAGLFVWKGQFHAQTLQQSSHVLECFGIELVAKAGNE
jgi:hypothetical protein